MSIKHVMIVDDSGAEQFLYQHLLNSYDSNIKITAVHDGLEALEYLTDTSENPDCILLDINMPRMNGFEFLDAYTEQFQNQHIIITMLTSSSQEKDRERALSYECVKDYFLKPISAKDLDKLNEIVSAK